MCRTEAACGADRKFSVVTHHAAIVKNGRGFLPKLGIAAKVAIINRRMDTTNTIARTYLTIYLFRCKLVL